MVLTIFDAAMVKVTKKRAGPLSDPARGDFLNLLVVFPSYSDQSCNAEAKKPEGSGDGDGGYGTIRTDIALMYGKGRCSE